jgi:carbonic anhydrase/acetyltransferase-like protein (isoleucine patch superfamily)
LSDKLVPQIHESVFVADGARIYGDVEIGEGSSVWFNAVIHSDMMVNVEIGDNVTVGHGAIVRGCRIGNNVIIGMNATVMTNVEIGDYSIVGANTFVPYNKMFPPRSLITGSPAQLVRKLKTKDIEISDMVVKLYEELAERYAGGKIAGYKGRKK